MNGLSAQHVRRAWRQHWALQLATVIVMTMILVLFNLLSVSVRGANQLLFQWGQGMEMVVYLKDTATEADLGSLREKLESSKKFESVSYTSKKSATETFLSSLGKDSSSLLKDPKWSSPIPASLEARLDQGLGIQARVGEFQKWAEELKKFSFVDDVFYGQGWIENFSRFLSQSRILIGAVWLLCLAVGLLIVGNCIRLSFLRRKEEIEVLELVGATARFIRTPFVVEGIFLGLIASIISILISYILHSLVLHYLKSEWAFWSQWNELRPMEFWMILVNLTLGVSFGALGAWLCVRKLNTGWSAAQGAR